MLPQITPIFSACKYLDYFHCCAIIWQYYVRLTRMRQMACHPDLVLRSKTNVSQFVQDASEATVCRLCNDIAEDAIQSRCRHIFDRECIRQYLESTFETNVSSRSLPIILYWMELLFLACLSCLSFSFNHRSRSPRSRVRRKSHECAPRDPWTPQSWQLAVVFENWGVGGRTQ